MKRKLPWRLGWELNGTEWNSGGLVKNLGWDEDGIKHIDEKP
jgi:hypothetical protein